jgi:hypothetical protein
MSGWARFGARDVAVGRRVGRGHLPNGAEGAVQLPPSPSSIVRPPEREAWAEPALTADRNQRPQSTDQRPNGQATKHRVRGRTHPSQVRPLHARCPAATPRPTGHRPSVAPAEPDPADIWLNDALRRRLRAARSGFATRLGVLNSSLCPIAHAPPFGWRFQSPSISCPKRSRARLGVHARAACARSA